MNCSQTVIKQIETGRQEISVTGLAGSAKAYLLSQLIREGPSRTYVYLGTSGKEAVRFQQDLQFFLGPYAAGELFLFPPLDVLPFSPLSPHNDLNCHQLATLQALRQKNPPAFVATTITAVLPSLPPIEVLEKSMPLSVGEEKGRDSFLTTLTEWGYQNVPVVMDRGNFSVRGAIVDLFDPLRNYPLRIEWAGETVESIREFDIRSQRSLQSIKTISLFPVRSVLLNPTTIQTFLRKARQLAEEKDIPRPQWGPLLEKVKERIPFSGIETYLPLFYQNATSFWDWLPPQTVFVSEDFTTFPPLIEDHLQEIQAMIHGKSPLLSLEESLLGIVRWEERIDQRQRLSFPVVARPDAISFTTETHEEIRREIELNKKGFEPLRPLSQRLQRWLETDAVFLIASSKHQADRLSDLLSPHLAVPLSVVTQSFAEITPTPATASLLIGDLTTGFRLPTERITLLTDEEIFGQKARRKFKETGAGEGLSSFASLKEGDPIVHKDHGIGLYKGLIPMTIDGCQNDFLLIEYRDGDKLYLPVYRMNLVHRYTGSDGRMPTLDRLGGTSWAKVKGKSEKAIRELAGELLNLYAARTAGHGFSFSPSTELLEAFEASFPFEETPDQENVITEVLSDMEKGRPMDRLVLGDVGYGKTEVALRAAFKAILDKKQVAFLVPTTLLAFQHYERSLQRFRDYPVTIEMLSRFRSPTEQKQVIRDLAQGKTDMVIATHRLLQPDISFKDLGLLIVDEEHRFGVEQKEKIKRLKKNVDVLALSATPIPRTLHMSLVGIRSISVIETPPTDRLAIRTFAMPFQEEVIREAILRELKRGGQSFFIHNEVATIGRMKEFLMKLVPEAKIEIAHGQMEEKELEEIMIRFFHQGFNLLLCTTIVESGIDIPTANTILMNNAQNFGLAQIYQLRGRVGRGNHRAYAYLLIPEEKKLTPEATKRFSVLQRFSELGSGYKMASYDLEIRGAGNLLGTHQSGHMTAIGYELYTEFLEKAVKELKGEKVLEEIDPELHFKIPALLPEDYVPDPPVRLELYRRLASLEGEEEVDPIQEELHDRFGPPPPEVENLLELSAIKCLAKRLRIKQIRHDGRSFVYAFDPSSPLPPELLTERIKREPRRYRLTPDFRFTVLLPSPPTTGAFQITRTFLRELSLHL